MGLRTHDFALELAGVLLWCDEGIGGGDVLDRRGHRY